MREETRFCTKCEATGMTKAGNTCGKCNGTGLLNWVDPANN